jgi:hypothetical protein
VYAADIVKALSRLREAYGDSVRGLHGFPVMAGASRTTPASEH